MTEHEQKLIENLTKQLELSNKIALKQMQEAKSASLNEERITEAELGLANEKERFFKNAADLLCVISTIIVITAILIAFGILTGLKACS